MKFVQDDVLQFRGGPFDRVEPGLQIRKGKGAEGAEGADGVESIMMSHAWVVFLRWRWLGVPSWLRSHMVISVFARPLRSNSRNSSNGVGW